MLSAAIDNDILFKGACYGLLNEFAAAIPSDRTKIGVLGAARFVIKAKLQRVRHSDRATEIMNTIEKFIREGTILEPTVEEAKVAAIIEFMAQQNGLTLDAGESQLCAMVVGRDFRWMTTGDKRAIRALEILLDHQPSLSRLEGRVICLEQLVRKTLTTEAAIHVRDAVCREADVDRSLTTCFSCSDATVNLESWLEGLDSYINDLRNSARRLLSV